MAQLSRLAQLYLKISDSLTEEDVRNLRSLLYVDKILEKGKTEKATPLEIFNMLVDNDTIGKGNLRLLVQVLRSLGKGELAEEAERLEQEQRLDGKEIHDSASEESEPKSTEVKENTSVQKPPGKPDYQHTKEATKDTYVHGTTPELASLHIRELARLIREPMEELGLREPDSTDVQHVKSRLETLLAELDTPAVMADQEQQCVLYCQIGDLYRAKLYNLQSALQYYQNMLECSTLLSEDTKQAKVHNRLGLTYDMLGKHEEATRSHERVLEICRDEFGDDADICVAYKNLATSLTLSGKVSEARANYKTALRLARETGNKMEEMDIHTKLGDLHRVQLKEPHISHRHYTNMLALATELRSKYWEMLAYNRFGLACERMEDNELALEWYRKHLKISQEIEDKKEEVTAHTAVGNAYRLLGNIEQATIHFDTALQLAQQTENRHGQMDVYCKIGEMQREQLHSPRTAIQYYEQYLILARQLGDRRQEGWAYNSLGDAHVDMGEYETALEWYQKHLTISQEIEDKKEEVPAHTDVGNAYRLLGKIEQATSHFNTALQLAQQTENLHGQMDVYCKMGDIMRVQLHSPRTAIQYYEQYLILARQLGYRRQEGWAYNSLGDAHVDMREYETALEWYQKHLTISQEMGERKEEVPAHTDVGNAYRLLGKIEEATSHFDTALQLAQQTENRYGQMDVYCKMGDMQKEQLHSPRTAIKYYEQYLALARQLTNCVQEAVAYNRLGLTHYEAGEYKTALEWLQKALKISQESGDKTAQITAHQYTAASYQALGELDLSIYHAQSALAITEETELSSDRSHTPFELRRPEMARVYEEACLKGKLPVHSTRVPVVGQFRSGKTCFINRLMGEPVREDEPITDGIQITSDVQTKTWKKSKDELDEFHVGMAGILLQTRQETENIAEKTADIDMTEVPPQENESLVSGVATSASGEHVDVNMPEMLPQKTESTVSDVATSERANDSVEMSETLLAQPGTAEETKVVTSADDITESQNRKVPGTDVTAIPSNVVETAERMQMAGFREDELGTVDLPRLSFWDFGGQATYYGTHHCFITYRGIYILVMSLLQKLSDPVPDLDYKASVDNLRTGGDYLDYWLNSIRSHTLHTRQPPVIIVLTHKDKVTQEYIGEYIEKIHGHIKDKAAGKLVKEKIFAVSNMTEDRTVDEIRDYVREVAKTLPHMGEEIPISWLHLNSKLKEKRKNGILFCKFQDIAKLARDPDIGIKDQHTLALVLTFLHDRGDVIYFDEPSLRDDVTLQPQVMIDVFKTIITVPQYQQDRQTDPEVRKMWERLEKEGILSDELLTRIWEKKDQQLEKPFLLQHKSFLKALMEKFYLICNATAAGDANDEDQQVEIYFVPALLSCERNNARLYPSNMYICPQALYFVFSEQFLPSGMFSRLQALCVRRFGLLESCVFAGCALFPTDDKEQAFVITKVKHYLKVELLSSSNVFSEGLRVRKFLSSALFEIKEKWIPCIQYELCCSTQHEDRGEPAFQPLPTEYRSLEQLWGVPSVFHAVWMPGTLQCDRTANSGGDGPVILQPLGDPDTIDGMRTIGPVLDTMEQGGGLTLDQCDHIRNQLTPIQRVKDMIRQGEVDPYQLGAAVEMCSPEFVDLFRREKRGKELAILHADDYTSEFVLPLQTAARESGLPCHTEIIKGFDSITDKAVELLLNTNNRIVALVISPQTLHHKHWSNLAYEFPVRNEKLLLPILLYPKGSRDRMVRVLQQRSHVLYGLAREEIEMEGRAAPQERLHKIVNRVMTDEERDFQQMLLSIFSRLDERDLRLLLRVWSARTGQHESGGMETPRDEMRAMMLSEYITAGDLGRLEKDMMAAGISFAAVARDIPGIPNELHHTRSANAFVGPTGGEMEISGFVKLIVPPGVLQRDTSVSVSMVDIPAILRGDEGASWTSGYPWSLGEDACPREVLDQTLFSPAVDVNLHGAQPDGPMELQVWRPPGSEDMECLLLKHLDEDGWTDITASTVHQVHSDKLSIFLRTFCPLCVLWTKFIDVPLLGNIMTYVLNSRTLDCQFSAYIKPHEDDVDFHVVCREKGVEKNEYLPGFFMCGGNKAMSDLYHGNIIEVTVSACEGKKEPKTINLSAKHCCDEDGQGVQMFLARRNGKVKGDVTIKTIHEHPPRTVCDFTFREEGHIPKRDGNKTNDHHPDTPVPQAGTSGTQTESNVQAGGDHEDPATHPYRDPTAAERPALRKEGFTPVVLMINDEYGTSNGDLTTTHSQMARLMALRGAKVYSTVLTAGQKDKDDAAADGVKLIFPHTFEGDDRKPDGKWLTFDHQTRYPNSKLPPNVDFIVGHVNITSRAAREIKDQRFPGAKLVQVTHVMPEDTSQYKGDEEVMSIGQEKADILDDLQHADVIVSVGPLLYDYYKNETRTEDNHHAFLPEPSEVFKNTRVKYVHTETKVVLSIGRFKGEEELKGYDIVAKSMGKVIDHLPHAKWRASGVTVDDFLESRDLIQANLKKNTFHFTPLQHSTQEELMQQIQQAHVVLMPSRAEPFGLVGLEAIAAGVPVLVSHKSGLAWFLREDPDRERPIVMIEDDVDKAAETLARRIIEILNNCEKEFEAAGRLRARLLGSKYWKKSHSEFLEIFGL